jgi:D-alanyl-lipoteichoic acid acyltransferase DltB (MBOAT superfamily)
MLFNSVQFGIFFVAVLLALRAAPWTLRIRILLGSSLLFYALWIPSYLLLLLGTLAVNYALLRAMARSSRPRVYLIASISVTLALLALFKYAAMFVETALPVLQAVIGTRPRPPELLLPLGISFYSFEIISLSVDVYKRRQPCPSFARYALFVTFFPHLIAGPIMRGHELLPQFETGGAPSGERTRRGLWLVAAGLAKKTIFADYLLAPFVNDVFAEPGAASAPVHLLAAYGFAFQIYFDFSGYTDLARGLACMLGFELPPNFAEPYLSRSASEFWRRWHMSLSRWLRDYLYIPLGGNRHGAARTSFNLLLTMLLGGLWHGAGWNFVVWGGLHGGALAATRFYQRWRGGESRDPYDPPWARVFCMLATFHFVCLAWVFFRSETLTHATAMLHQLTRGSTHHENLPVEVLAVLAIGIGSHLLPERWFGGVQGRWVTSPAAVQGALLFGVAWILRNMSGADAVPFVYFQF